MPLMKLDVLQPWYAQGLKFTCTQCGNCCTGGPGFVWISQTEVQRLAEFLHVTAQEVLNRYCRKVAGRWSLREQRTPHGQYDCIFLSEDSTNGRSRRSCAIYPVRPLQCRTWPFWESNLSSQKMWDAASRRCPGMNQGARAFSREQIEQLRDARDWPVDPPTSSSRRPTK